MMRILVLSIFLGLATPAFAVSKVFTFTGLDIQCAVPTSWIYRDRNNDLVNAVDPQHHKCFLLRATRNTYGGTLDDPGYLQSLEPSYVASGYNITRREKVEVNGVKFYKLTMAKDLGAKTLRAADYVTFANDYGYCMETTEFDDDPDADKELQNILATVRFITPPVISSKNRWAALFTPRDGRVHDATFLFTYRIAMMAILVFLLACPLILLGAIGTGIYLLVR